MTVTVETLAAALREALPECAVYVHLTGGTLITVLEDSGMRPMQIILVESTSELDELPTIWYAELCSIEHRVDRDLARLVFDVIDRLEDRRDAKNT